jgi:tRNA(adenine34) deaminase
MNHISDEQWMRYALSVAQSAISHHEVPVGCIIVKNNELVATGFNQTIMRHDPSAHAEIIALRAAGIALENYRLNDVTVYVTLEPCPMCMMALVHARVSRIVFATRDLKMGACGSVINLSHHVSLNHHIQIDEGILSQESRCLLQQFFQSKR